MAFIPQTDFEDCTGDAITPQYQQICDNIVISQIRSEECYSDFASSFSLFVTLFQVLFLSLVIVYIGKWFWKLIW